MADGAPALERLVTGEQGFLDLLKDTDNRLQELEWESFVAASADSVVTVLDIDQLLVYPSDNVRAWVISEQAYYVPTTVKGQGVGPGQEWRPE